MHFAQFMTINQVLDNLVASVLSLLINTFNNIPLDSCWWRSDILKYQKKSRPYVSQIGKETVHICSPHIKQP